MKIGDKVDVPQEALTVKALFFEEPNDDVIEEILSDIRQNQTIFNRWHTHTKPPKDTRIKYLGEYQLTKDTPAPCLCCLLFTAKYFKEGFIVWFPDEGVIRLMGHVCFKKLNKDADTARSEYIAERGRKAQIANLLKNLGIIPAARAVIASSKIISIDLDKFRKELLTVLNIRLDIRLRDHARDGILMVDENGLRRVYASGILGMEILNPFKGGTIVKLLEEAEDCLNKADLGPSFASYLEKLSDERRDRIAIALRNGLDNARRALEAIHAMRQFTSVVTVKTMNAWGQHPGCPIQIVVSREGKDFWIGKFADCEIQIKLGDGYDQPVPTLPPVEKADFRASRVLTNRRAA